MTAKLTLVLALPILISFYFSTAKDIYWLLLSIVSLAMIVYVSVNMIGGIANRLSRRVLGLVIIFLFAAFELCRLASFYFQGESFNERFFFHFNLNSVHEAGSAYQPVMGIVLAYLFVTALMCWIWFGKHHQGKSLPIPVQILFLIAALFILEPDISKFNVRQIQAMISAEKALSTDNIDWNKLALNSESLSAAIGDVVPGKNLVFVYLESLEGIYTEEQLFPGLTPHLNKLKQSGLTFTRMQQTEGTGWTVGGMVASQCGTPLLYSSGSGGNDFLQNGFLNQAICLGDILKQAGYYQVFLGGASTQFAGKGDFLASHGYDEVKGKTELSGQLEDSAYISGWGLYDDSLFAIAEEKFKWLAQVRQPFNLTLLTLDTHHPGGHASRSCPKYKALQNSMLDAVHCTDFLLNQFLASISKHPAWENTLVVLFSDHLAMRNVAQKYYPDDYDRQLLFVILNAGNKEEINGEINITGSHMDIAPTLLHLMGVKHDRQFLAGNNLINVTQQPSVDILSSTQRLDTLRYINKHLLTGLNNSLCESDYLVNVHDDTIRIGDHGITMHLSGQPIAQESLGFGHAILAILNGRKEIEHTLTVNLENLHFALHQHWGSPFLLIARADYLPAFIKTGREQDDEISVLWKKPNGEIDYLGGNQDPAYLKIKNPGCPRQPAKNDHTNEMKAPIHNLLEICQTDDSGENYVDRETGNIHLPKVAHGNTWYNVVLTQTIADQYGIADLTPLGKIIPSPKSGYCHAYFGNNELIIPSLKSEKQMHIVKLQLIPDTDGQFKITEKIKRY